MTIRTSVSAAVLMLGVAVASPAAMGQSSSSGRSSSANTNTASQTAGKAVAKAQADINKLQAELNKIQAKVRNQVLAKPEWAQVVAGKKAAEANADTARKAALAGLHAKPEFKTLVKERDDAQQVVTAYGATGSQVSQADYDKASTTVVNNGFAMKKMEMEALREDPKYTEASQQLEAANAKMKEVDSQVQLQLKDDTEYQGVVKQQEQAKTALAAAKTQLAQARQQEEQTRQQQAKSRQQQQQNGGGF